MPGKIPAKVDYLKPLEDKPYAQIVAERAEYHQEVRGRLVQIVGVDGVKDDPDTLKRYSQNCSFEAPGSPSFVVFPHTAEQVSALVKYANEVNMPVVPASSGTHLYGAAMPRLGGMVIDLSGWKSIYKIDYRNRAVRIAPGVTYDDLQNVLEKQGLRALMPLLPRKDQSVLTAHVEAHPMLIPEFNYSEPLYTVEIVMPNGEMFRTGAAAVAPAETTGTDLIGPWGPGFDWNRLYTRAQGTLGIITWGNIMAEPLPTKQKIFFTPFETLHDLADFTYQVLRKWIGYECFGLNKTQMAFILAESMPDDYRLLRELLPEYTQIFCIAGLKRFPDERIAYQEADFFGVAQSCGVHPQSEIPGVPHAASFFHELLRRSWHKEIYWKDAYKGSSADLFFIAPMEKASRFVAAVKEEADGFNYPGDDIGVYLQPIENGRASHLECTFPFNPRDDDERNLVQRLHRAASERAYALGAHFTRAYGYWAEMVYGRNALQYSTAKLIKETLDPHNIMNPGKLGL